MASPEHTHAESGHDVDDHHGLSHTASIPVLVGTGGALLILTILTVSATKIDLGPNYNLMLAMLIAVVKATLVVLFFMHLKYDKLFHTVILVAAICAASLFVGFTLMDSNQYQQTNIWNPDNPPPAPYGPRPVSG